MKKLLIVGSLNLDYVMSVSHLPQNGETILGQSLKLNPGGKGANQACAAGKLGAPTYMIGAVGDDDAGTLLKTSLASVGVDVSAVETLSGVTTGAAFIPVSDDGANCIIVIPGANACVTPAALARHEPLFMECDYVLCQLEIPHDTVLYAAQLAKKHGKTVILDPAPAPEAISAQLLELADIIKPNETELSALTGMSVTSPSEAETAALALSEKSRARVIVTLGGTGSLLVENGVVSFVPGIKVCVKDTTAAGDCYTAALACALADGAELLEAMRYATKASALSVTRSGAQPSLPSADDVKNFFVAQE